MQLHMTLILKTGLYLAKTMEANTSNMRSTLYIVFVTFEKSVLKLLKDHQEIGPYI